jgi:hypothetical protein
MFDLTRRGFLVLGATAALAACSTTIPVLPKAAASTPENLTDAEILTAINALRAAMIGAMPSQLGSVSSAPRKMRPVHKRASWRRRPR